MNSIPIVLRPHPGDHSSTTIDSLENRGSYAAIAGQDTATDGANGTSGDQDIEGAAEYSADDAVDIGDTEGQDKSKEALTIQKAVRRYLHKRIEGCSDDKLKVGRDRLFKACKVSAGAVHAKYRKIFLGPVPLLKRNKYVGILSIAVTTLQYITISMITIFSMYIAHVR